jgi:hypothetical protein
MLVRCWRGGLVGSVGFGFGPPDNAAFICPQTDSFALLLTLLTVTRKNGLEGESNLSLLQARLANEKFGVIFNPQP